MRDEVVAERLHLGPELGRLGRQLGEGRLQSVADLDLAALQRSDELALVVARDAECVAGGDHAHDQPQDARGVGSAVHQVADEDRLAVTGRDCVDRAAELVADKCVAELDQQRLELAPATVDVADDVEGAVLVLEVVEELLAHDDGVGDVLLRAQDVDLAEAFLAEVLERAAELVPLAPYDGVAEVPVGPGGVAVQADPLRQVEHDGDRQDVVVTGEGDELPTGLRRHVGRVDDGQAAGGQPLAGDVVQDVEGRSAGCLVVLVVGHQTAAEVAGQHLEGPEVLLGEGRLAGAARADETDQGQLRDGEPGHAALRKTAIWVGGPTSGSSSPTGR